MSTANPYLKELESLIFNDAKPAAAPAAAPAPAPEAPKQINFLENLQTLLNTSIDAKPTETKPKEVVVTNTVVQSNTKKLTLMLVSTHCHQVTGYSKVSYNLIKQLSELPWLNVVHFGFQRLMSKQNFEGRDYPSNVKVIDAAGLEKPLKQGFGYEQLPAEIARVKPNIVMIYNDMAVISQFMEAIKKSGIKRDFKTWLYVDQVYDCQLQVYLDVINREADRVFTFTQGWKECLKEQGIHRPIDVIAHGFDEKMFYPIPKGLARKKLSLPDDLFLFVTVNRNQPRKRLDLLIMAFVELIVKYPSKPIALLCVCDKGEKGGWWLFELFMRELKLRKVPLERFGNRLLVTSRDMDYKDEEINAFYNAADCCISTADGEGFGLCTFESMGVGIPQIVPNLGGYKEFCNVSNSIMVDPKTRYYLPMVFCPVGGEAHACDPHDICLAMETYVNDSELRARHGAAGKETIKKYSWPACVATFIRRLNAQYDELDSD